MAGKDGKQHQAPTSSGEIARKTEVGQRAQRTNYVQNCASILPLEDKLLIIINLELVEAAGVELPNRIDNKQLIDSKGPLETQETANTRFSSTLQVHGIQQSSRVLSTVPY